MWCVCVRVSSSVFVRTILSVTPSLWEHFWRVMTFYIFRVVWHFRVSFRFKVRVRFRLEARDGILSWGSSQVACTHMHKPLYVWEWGPLWRQQHMLWTNRKCCRTLSMVLKWYIYKQTVSWNCPGADSFLCRWVMKNDWNRSHKQNST